MGRLRRVGEKAPDFQAMAFHEGKSSDIHLTLFQGKWIILLFYVGNFTIV